MNCKLKLMQCNANIIVAYLWTYLILNVNLVQQDATIQDIGCGDSHVDIIVMYTSFIQFLLGTPPLDPTSHWKL
jgi:hypothetical protein